MFSTFDGQSLGLHSEYSSLLVFWLVFQSTGGKAYFQLTVETASVDDSENITIGVFVFVVSVS